MNLIKIYSAELLLSIHILFFLFFSSLSYDDLDVEDIVLVETVKSVSSAAPSHSAPPPSTQMIGDGVEPNQSSR